MRKIIKYPLIWIIAAILLLVALSIDNLFWVNASPEWLTRSIVHRGDNYWIGPIQQYKFDAMFDYLISYRVISVWTNWRDLLAAIIVGSLAVLFSIVYDKFHEKRYSNYQQYINQPITNTQSP